MKIQTQLTATYLKQFQKKDPADAILELIWNALDADATSISIDFDRNIVGSIEGIKVADNGHGIEHSKVEIYFGGLGHSEKVTAKESPGGRALHGSRGQGRFIAYSLSSHVQWKSTYKLDEGGYKFYTIKGHSDGSFEISDPVDSVGPPGTNFYCSISRDFKMDYDDVEGKLLPALCIYLKRYPDVKIYYDGRILDPERFVENRTEELVSLSLGDVPIYDAKLQIVEWRQNFVRGLYLCDAKGAVYYHNKLAVTTKGMKPSVYLFSDSLKDVLAGTGPMAMELDPNLNAVLEFCNQQVKKYYRKEQRRLRREKIDSWRVAGIYPFESDADADHAPQRSVFDAVAIEIEEKLPRFKMADADTQRLMFRLLKAVVEAGDPHLWKILQEVLKLTPDEREAFSELLDRTSLSALIQMNTLVANRLDFLDDLRLLVADPFYKKKMLERKQLHKILNRESWIFGDQFTLLSSDQRMTAVLEQYCSFVDVPFDGAPVENDDVIDLFFGGKTPGVGFGAENNFLVVEIKRPKVKIGREELEQTRRYRTNICSDERFAAAAAKWTFIALSTEIADSVSLEVYGGRVPGLVDDKTYKGVRTEIWCKTWQQLIDEAELQLKLFKVQVGTSLAQNFDYLKKKHGDLLPGWAEDASGEVGAPMELLASASADVVAN